MWIDEAALSYVSDTETTHGRPCLHSTASIQALPGIKAVFRLPPRALQGFAQSLREQTFATLPVTSYTALCRRAQTRRVQTLEVQLPIVSDGEPIHLVVDSTA